MGKNILGKVSLSLIYGVGVALLPFIDEHRLLKAMEKYNHGLTEEEVIRNSKGPDVVFVAEQCRLFESMTVLYTKKYEKETDELLIDPKRSKHIFGHFKRDPEVCLPGTTMSGYIDHDEFDDFLNVNSIR
jgi:5'-3' exoribonuclease 2